MRSCFGSKLRSARVRCGLSQDDLACMVGVSQQTVSALECGTRQCPPDLLPRFVAVLGDTSLVEVFCSACPAATAVRSRRGAA